MIKIPEFTGALSEYPRPQLRRNSYISLNGEWEYAFSQSHEAPDTYDGVITVPYSPESPRSNVGRQLKKTEVLHYKKVFASPAADDCRVILNIGACDQVCDAYVNGTHVGAHEGGYLPFSFDITDALRPGDNVLTLVVTDDAEDGIHGYGKQRYKRGGIWYTAISGLWQSVWLECVPREYVTGLVLTPDAAAMTLTVDVRATVDAPFRYEITDGGSLIAEGSGTAGIAITVPLQGCKLWTPDSPELYDIKVTLGADVVTGYFGMRSFSVTERAGTKYFALNGEPIFHHGLLDQGYWGDGIYTPESNRQMYDLLRAVKSMGFNMLRKHIKVEPLLWYHYCDCLGILVWQDMVNGGGKVPAHRLWFGPFVNLHLNDKNYKQMKRAEPRSREQYLREADATVELLRSSTSVCLWTPFNEGWGQFDAAAMADRVRALDPTRHIDHASGWQDKGKGDVCSKHIYFRKAKPKNDGRRVLALTEFGGYAYNAGGTPKKAFGYKTIRSADGYLNALERLYLGQIVPSIKTQGLCGAVYTQLTDVEDEINGIFTADLKPKVDSTALRAIADALYAAFKERVKE